MSPGGAASGAAERTLQDVARQLKLKRSSGESRLSIQTDPSPQAVTQPADPDPPQPEATPPPHRPRVTVTSASYGSPQGEGGASVPVRVTLVSSGPGDACSVPVIATLTADDGSLLGKGQATLEVLSRGQTTTVEVQVAVPPGTRVEVRGPTYTLYSGYGAGKRVASAAARVGTFERCP